MTIKVKERVKAAEPRKETCRHYWVIEVANGPASQGQCKFCGAKKEFFNAFPEFNPLKKGQAPVKLPALPRMEAAADVEEDDEDESLVTG